MNKNKSQYIYIDTCRCTTKTAFNEIFHLDIWLSWLGGVVISDVEWLSSLQLFFVFLIDCKPNLVDIIVTLSNYLPDEVLKIHYTMIKSNGFSFYYIVFFITLKNVDLNTKSISHRWGISFRSKSSIYVFAENKSVWWWMYIQK